MTEKKIAKLAKQIAKIERQANAGEMTYTESEERITELSSGLSIEELVEIDIYIQEHHLLTK